MSCGTFIRIENACAVQNQITVGPVQILRIAFGGDGDWPMANIQPVIVK